MSQKAIPKVVVIGAGIGGLSAAIDLSCQGAKVTLLEGHSVVGGKVHQTQINGVSIDSGPTVFTMRSVFEQLFLRAGATLGERINLTQLDTLARHFWHGSQTLDLFSDVEKTCSAIANFASPQEANKYRVFAQKSEAIFNALDDSFMQKERPGMLELSANAGMNSLYHILSSPPFISLWHSLCFSFADPRLRQLFARYSTYCGSSPYKAPATLMLIAHAERAGVWVVEDGLLSLANAMASLAEEHGCDIRLNSTAQRIECKSGAVSGVSLADGSFIQADAVVYNGDIGALHDGQLGEAVSRAVAKPKVSSLSAITLSCVTPLTCANLSVHNVFFGANYRAEFDALFKKKSIADDPTIYVNTPDQYDGCAPDALTKQRLFCLMNAPATTFEAHQIEDATQKLLSTLASHGLQIDAVDDERVVATPNAFAQRFPGSVGALYGQATHGSTGTFTRSGSRSLVPGLYLAGGGVHPGAGVPMVSLSGQLAAKSILSDFNLS